jgi:hypothetical protein
MVELLWGEIFSTVVSSCESEEVVESVSFESVEGKESNDDT